MTNCLQISVVFDERLKKGICLGVEQNPLSFERDLCRVCMVTEKPVQGVKCKTLWQAQVTPNEAIGVGVALIQSSVVGNSIIRRKQLEKAQKDDKP